jgi:hypothetical protein
MGPWSSLDYDAGLRSRRSGVQIPAGPPPFGFKTTSFSARAQLSEEAFDIHSKAMESIFTGDVELANTSIEGYKKFIEQ